MGAQPKPFCAIFFDYVVIVFFGASYWAIVHLWSIRNQCIPDNPQQHNGRNCAQSDVMKDPTPFLAFPHIDNEGIWHPVPVWGPYVLGACNWMVVMMLSLLKMKPKMDRFKDIFRKIEALWREVLTTIIITQATCGFIKTYVGRPRPNYYNYVDIDANDAISSFPSGHASSTFCIHMLLIYHVMSAMNWAHTNNEKDLKICGADNVHSLFGAEFWQKTRYVLYLMYIVLCIYLSIYALINRNFTSFNVMVVISMLIIPVWISCTRIIDYYHNYSDVLAGAFIGILISTIVYTIYHKELYPHQQFYNKAAAQPLLDHMTDTECTK